VLRDALLRPDLFAALCAGAVVGAFIVWVLIDRAP
jgi:hypothetical protein